MRLSQATGLFVLLIVAQGCLSTGGTPAAGQNELRMSTTSSVDNTGLLDYLSPHFLDDTGLMIRWHAVGSGQAMADGRLGNADVLLVHDPEAEQRFVAEGHGSARLAVMQNEFLIVGPAADPAGVAGAANARDAFANIRAREAFFASRGDDSGTHSRERLIWGLSDFDYDRDIDIESNAWYRSTGQGMGATLRFASETGAYALTDDATFYAYEGGLDLVILLRNDPPLDNHYSVIPVNGTKHPGVDEAAAWTFSRWITAARGQDLISSFTANGRQLFQPEAATVAL